MNDETKVTDTPGEVAEEATPATGVEEQTSTPETPSADAELSDVETIKRQFEAQTQKLNQDLNAMKSVFQKQISQREKEWKQREEDYNKQIEQLKIATMDDDQRKAYESTSIQRKAAELEQQLAALQNQNALLEAKTQAQAYFASQGVPVEALNLEGDYDDLWASGMEYLTEELKNLRKAAVQKSTSKTQVQAPPVVTSNNAPAQSGTTWEALRKRLGVETDDEIYAQVESGQLDPDVLPKH